MKIMDVLSSDFLSELRTEVNRFTERSLKNYLSETHSYLQNYRDKIESKDIYDAVWGTIAFNSGEIIIIDSPLVQRLRQINHLGLASLLFPGAEYSRFEHTLGTVSVADKIVSKVYKSIKKKQNITHKFPPVQLVRLAAIFHDVGHLFFSHGSERFFSGPFFSRHELIEETLLTLREKIGQTSIKLSELLSCLIVVSPAAKNLLKLAAYSLDNIKLPAESDVDDLCGLLASLILGVPVEKQYLPYSTIISGPIDADKCDYLARDSHRTGVPVAVDLYRVIQKLIPLKGMPKDFSKVWDSGLQPTPEDCWLLGIALSAVRSVEEIIISRTLMHEKIYFHHKILSAERLLHQALWMLDRSGCQLIRNFDVLLQLTDNTIQGNHVDTYLTALAKSLEIPTDWAEEPFKVGCNILKNISNRNLPKRVCAFSTELLESTEPAADVGSFIGDIFEKNDSKYQKEFMDYIIKEVRNVLKIMEKQQFATAEYESQIVLVPYPALYNDRLNMPIEVGDKLKWYREIFQGELWDGSRKAKTACNYLVAPREMLKEVLIALETVMLNVYNITINSEAFELCKLSSVEVASLKTELVEKNYYQDKISLIPSSGIFNSGHVARLDNLIKKWGHYQGPLGYRITSIERIEQYLKQFYSFQEMDSDTLDGLVLMLEKIDLVDREQLVNGLIKTVEYIASKESVRPSEIILLALGDLQDSSNHIAYYVNDLRQHFVEDVKIYSARELGKIDCGNRPLLFVEDAFYSGTQIISIFQEMCGLPPEERATVEQHGGPLCEKGQQYLKDNKCYLSFCYANEENKQRIIDALSEIHLNVEILFSNKFYPGLFRNGGQEFFRSIAQKNKVKSILNKTGLQLLINNKKENGNYKNGWDEERISQSTLGYNNAQQLIVLPWNTPTYSVTSLWLKGKLECGQEWKPLFPRVLK